MWEIVILLGVLALLFGAKGIPQVARRLGTGVREVKDAVAEKSALGWTVSSVTSRHVVDDFVTGSTGMLVI